MNDLETSVNTCKNCNHTFTKQYCNGCGQKNADRITLKHLMHDVVHAVFHADKGIFPYMKKLILGPGVLAREYIDGKRKTFNPMQFLVLSIGFVVLLMTITDFYKNIEIWQAQNVSADQQGFNEKLNGFYTFLKKNGNLIALILMPISALSGYLMYRKQNNNYAEHFMLAVFAMSLSNMLTAVVLVISYFVGLDVMYITMCSLVCAVISFYMIYKQFYQIHWFQSLWRSLAVYSLTMVAYMILVMIVTILILIVSFL